MKKLSNALETNISLKEFRLGSKQTNGYEALTILTSGLANNKNITKLDLSSCKLGNEGAEVLSKILKSMVVTNLNIENCNIRTDGLISFIKSIKDNNNLAVLRLKDNTLKEQTESKGLMKDLEDKGLITTIEYIDKNYYTALKAVVKELEDLVQNNSNIIKVSVNPFRAINRDGYYLDSVQRNLENLCKQNKSQAQETLDILVQGIEKPGYRDENDKLEDAIAFHAVHKHLGAIKSLIAESKAYGYKHSKIYDNLNIDGIYNNLSKKIKKTVDLDQVPNLAKDMYGEIQKNLSGNDLAITSRNTLIEYRAKFDLYALNKAYENKDLTLKITNNSLAKQIYTLIPDSSLKTLDDILQKKFDILIKFTTSDNPDVRMQVVKVISDAYKIVPNFEHTSIIENLKDYVPADKHAYIDEIVQKVQKSQKNQAVYKDKNARLYEQISLVKKDTTIKKQGKGLDGVITCTYKEGEKAKKQLKTLEKPGGVYHQDSLIDASAYAFHKGQQEILNKFSQPARIDIAISKIVDMIHKAANGALPDRATFIKTIGNAELLQKFNLNEVGKHHVEQQLDMMYSDIAAAKIEPKKNLISKISDTITKCLANIFPSLKESENKVNEAVNKALPKIKIMLLAKEHQKKHGELERTKANNQKSISSHTLLKSAKQSRG